jgi:nucleoid-associated protein YgaU
MFVKSEKENDKTQDKDMMTDEDKKTEEDTKTMSEEDKNMEDNTKQEEILGTKNKDGKERFIRWGDNLWTICKDEYGSPWYYSSLAEYNDIPNPRLIYAGKTIIIPPKTSLEIRW